jgi:phosphoribosylanthranilate isomerase
VGVFVNEALETVRQILDFCQLDAVQLHGDESPAEVASFAGIAYKALRPKSVAEAYELVAAYTPLPEQKAGSRKQEEQLAISNEQLTNPAFQPSSLPPLRLRSGQALQPSSLPAFQPSNLPTLLLDAYHPHLYGGTGNRVDWAIAAEIARTQRLMLAGSLTPENVAEAVRAVRPWGVDVSSGVEATKGKKDHGKVRAFVNNVKRKT